MQITPSKVSASSDQIKPRIQPPRGVSFSWRYYKHGTSKFTVSRQERVYFCALLLRLRDLSQQTQDEIIATRNQSLRAHPINFNDPDITENSFGFPKEKEIITTPYQISISTNRGRIHGWFDNDIFYIRWLDPDHELDPRHRN